MGFEPRCEVAEMTCSQAAEPFPRTLWRPFQPGAHRRTRGDDEVRTLIKQIAEDLVRCAGPDAVRRQRDRRKVAEIPGHDDLGADAHGGGQNVPIGRVRKLHRFNDSS